MPLLQLVTGIRACDRGDGLPFMGFHGLPFMALWSGLLTARPAWWSRPSGLGWHSEAGQAPQKPGLLLSVIQSGAVMT
jgi:hypothetical protein